MTEIKALKDENRPFPIQKELGHLKDPWNGQACTIPWWLAQEAYAWYAHMYGTSQSLERIAERGGFGRAELIMLLRHAAL